MAGRPGTTMKGSVMLHWHHPQPGPARLCPAPSCAQAVGELSQHSLQRSAWNCFELEETAGFLAEIAIASQLNKTWLEAATWRESQGSDRCQTSGLCLRNILTWRGSCRSNRASAMKLSGRKWFLALLDRERESPASPVPPPLVTKHQAGQ